MGFTHSALHFYYRKKLHSFENGLNQLEVRQRQQLQCILKNSQKSRHWAALLEEISSYEDLIQKIPVMEYADYKALIEEQKSSGLNILAAGTNRYEPTSGSTEQRKWIPYSKNFLAELNEAAAVWMADVYRSYPAVKRGSHYWSLSWLPEELRKLTTSNDAELFPWWQKFFLKNLMSVPPQLAQAPSAEAAWYATLCFLYSRRDLSLVSVWSPYFFLKAATDIRKIFPQIQKDLESRSWGRYEKDLAPLFPPPPSRADFAMFKSSEKFLHSLWPKLSLLSSWDSALSEEGAADLKELFQGAAFQGKGLWATEGVVTIPYQNKKILASSAHFYEFRCLQSGQILPSWKLRENQEVQPIIWTSSGLFRYTLADKMKVTGFVGQTPCLEFLGRLQGVDLVGEKMDSAAATLLLKKLTEKYSCQPSCFLAVQGLPAFYTLAVVSAGSLSEDLLDQELGQFHHYKVARELGQLGSAQIRIISDSDRFWQKLSRSPVMGQNKREVLYLLDSADFKAMAF